MDWDHVNKNWGSVKAKAKTKWGKLTDDDLKEINGSQGALEAKLCLRYGYNPAEARTAVEGWYTAEGFEKKEPTTPADEAKANADPAPQGARITSGRDWGK